MTKATLTSIDAGRLWHRIGVAAGPAGIALFALNFGAYRVSGDGVLYFAFLQRMFGDDPQIEPSAYNFGLGLLNAPFYGIGRLGQAAGIAGRFSHELPAAAITLASIVYVLAAAILCARLIERLGLPHPWLATTLAVFGSPVWYYASFSPSYTHAADAAVFSAVAVMLLGLWRQPTIWRAVAVGGGLGLAITVRQANLGLLAGLCVTLLAYSRVRDAVVTGVAAVASLGLLAFVPLGLGVSFEGIGAATFFGFYPLSPLRMLFSDTRGLFVWTPLTLLATVGVVRLLSQRPRDGYFVALAAMAAGLLAFHSSFKGWNAGWSFSARFLACLVPFYAIGLAALLGGTDRRRRALVTTLAVVTTVWSLFIGMNHAFGADLPDGATDIVSAYFTGTRTPRDFVHLTWMYSRVRHLIAPP